jgi:hypothetical protein
MPSDAMPFPPDRAPEALKGGRFVLVGSLGEGAQGHTFDAVDKGDGRPVAIKRFDVRGAKTWKDYELAERETRVLQSLSHPKLPRYLDHFEEDGALYLVMEKIDGESLAALQKRGGMLPEPDVLRLLRDASDVLDYLHQRSPPVIHRDLKPGNVIRRPDGSFAFVDFGAVRDKLRPEGGSTVVGTFGYMAPEQFQGRALPASDVYSVGATALSLLTGRQPEELSHKGLAIDVRTALAGRASQPLAEMLTSMLDPDPDRRPARLAPLLDRFERRSPSPSVGDSWGRPGSSRAPSQTHVGSRRADEAWRDVLSERFEAQAEEYEERARDLDRRAAGGGPGARGWRRGAEGWRRGARKLRAAAERQRTKTQHEADHRLRHQAERDAWRAARAARRSARRGNGRPPWPVAIFLALLFTVGMVAVALATQVVVPTLLRFLATFFASRALNTAAEAVRESGQAAVDGINRSRRWFLSSDPVAAPGEPANAGHVRVVDEAGVKVRVEPGETPEVDDAEDDGSAAGPGRASR